MRPWLAVMAVATAGILGCDARPDAPKTELESRQSLGKGAPAAEPAPSAVGRGFSGEADAAATDQLPSSTTPAESVAPTMIVRSGSASVEVDSLEPALLHLRRLAGRLGGYIANTSMQAGRDQLRQATLEVKVPAARFDDLTAGLQPLGKVEDVNVTAEDVGEEYTDITARVANARRLEERLISLLANRTGKLQDVLETERELARVRETIERYEGRMRYLRARAAVSTLAVTVHEPLPLLSSDPGASVIGDAFVRAWRNFVGVIAAFIASLGFLVPLAAVIGPAVFLVRRYRYRRP